MIVPLLVWADDGARTKPRRFKPFIHFVYKGKLTALIPSAPAVQIAAVRWVQHRTGLTHHF